jgi:hypothetical protein
VAQVSAGHSDYIEQNVEWRDRHPVSFDIGGVNPAQNSRPIIPAAPQTPATNDSLPVSGTEADAVEVDTMPASPPDEVMTAISAASSAYDRLEAGGQHLHFALDEPNRGLSVEVHDLSGNVLSTISPSDVLAIAGGATVN